jgi:hypothetical protein
MSSHSIKSLINDYLAPEQPDDCREATTKLLAKALGKHDGPFVYRGQAFSVAKDGSILADPAPETEEVPADEGTPNPISDTPDQES